MKICQPWLADRPVVTRPSEHQAIPGTPNKALCTKSLPCVRETYTFAQPDAEGHAGPSNDSAVKETDMLLRAREATPENTTVLLTQNVDSKIKCKEPGRDRQSQC